MFICFYSPHPLGSTKDALVITNGSNRPEKDVNTWKLIYPYIVSKDSFYVVDLTKFLTNSVYK